MKAKKILLCLIVFVSLFFAQGHCACLHLFIVANIKGGGKDAILKVAIEKDVAALQQEAKTISDHTGLNVKEYLFVDSHVNVQKIMASLKNLSTAADDVVFFYFTGHGYTTKDQYDDEWPNLVIRGKGLPLSSVVSMCELSKAHLKIFFADCCNNVLPDSYAPVIKKRLPINSINARKNYRKLFLDCSGKIIIGGCKKTQLSLATIRGSFCSRSFLKSLHAAIHGPLENATWHYVLDLTSFKVQSYAQKYSKNQDMIFAIER